MYISTVSQALRMSTHYYKKSQNTKTNEEIKKMCQQKRCARKNGQLPLKNLKRDNTVSQSWHTLPLIAGVGPSNNVLLYQRKPPVPALSNPTIYIVAVQLHSLKFPFPYNRTHFLLLQIKFGIVDCTLG